jgi:hypothetical protein
MTESFAVELRSLTDFAEELATQLAGMVQPLGQLETLTERELRLGAFGEARSLGQHHGAALAELHVLLGQARDAIDFAREVTAMVNDAYRKYDTGLAGTLHGVGHAVQAVTGGVLPVADVPGDRPDQRNR